MFTSINVKGNKLPHATNPFTIDFTSEMAVFRRLLPKRIKVVYSEKLKYKNVLMFSEALKK